MKLKERQWIIGGLFILIAAIFTGRLVQLQFFDPAMSEYAARLTEEREILIPARGIVYDRNGEVILTNKAGYDLLFTPRQCKLAGGMDTLALAELLQMPLVELKDAIQKAEAYATYRPSVIRRQIPAEDYAKVAGELWRYPGLQSQRRSIRTNPSGLASHLLGEYREVDRDDLKSGNGYRNGDYKGKSGLELQWENELKGTSGIRHHIVDIRNDFRAAAQEGQLDTMPIPGQDLHLTLDLALQAYGEKLMSNKRGAIVAIEPATGEVLAIISAPSYPTDLLTGRLRGEHYSRLLADSDKPLFNRTLRATYRPGSIFKIIQGLIALENNQISPSTRIPCDRDIIGCHGPHSFDNLTEAIAHSCNPYFHEVMRRMIQKEGSGNIFQNAHNGLANWSSAVRQFGLGTDLGGNFPGLRSGTVPDTTYYDNLYGRRRWAYSTIYSISIGEGELLTTPLHMANLASILANRGFYKEPHVVREIGEAGKPAGMDDRVESGVSSVHFQPVIDAMEGVVNSRDATGRRASTPNITVCGKTGTVQDGQGNHSVFIAFAPKDNPQIALSIYVENAGAGGDWAAPIASLMIEQYIKGAVTQKDKESRVMNATYPFLTHQP